MYRIYNFINVATNKALTLEGKPSSITTKTNVVCNIYAADDAQKWITAPPDTNQFIRTKMNLTLGINVYRSGNPYNCDVMSILGNEYDSTVNFTPALSFNTINNYQIKLANYNYVLTVDSNTEGANVYWAPPVNGSLYQLWRGECLGIYVPPVTKTLDMPVNHNSKYNGNEAWVQQTGCLVCCAADMSSYNDRSKIYSIKNITDVAVNSDHLLVWGSVPKVKLVEYYKSSYTQNDYLSKIRSEIENNRPVVVRCMNASKTRQHWTVAFKYVNSASTINDIYVLDSAGTSTTSTVGEIRTIAQSMQYNGNTQIERLRTTLPKS